MIESSAPLRLALRIVAEAGVARRIGGIEPGARCSLRLPRRELPAFADAKGELHFVLEEHDTGAAVFTCLRGGAP